MENSDLAATPSVMEDEIDAAALEIAQRYMVLADEAFEQARLHAVLACGLCVFSLVLLVMS